MKSNKASILVITLLILFAASIFALLSLNSIRFLITNSSLTYQYLASKYITKWVSELELLKSKKHTWGIEDTITSGSDTVKKNIKLTYQWVYWEADAMVLWSGEICVEWWLSGIVLPLFWWGERWRELPVQSNDDFVSLDSVDSLSILATWDVVVALVPQNIEEMYLNPSKYKIIVNNSNFEMPIELGALNYNPDEKNFLVVLVRAGEDMICLKSSTKFPVPYQTIYTLSTVGKFMVGEKVTRKLKLPGWLTYMIIGN